jgi:hypothetical protein
MMKENFANFTERTPLLPGSSCFKLSPTDPNKEINKEKLQQKD